MRFTSRHVARRECRLHRSAASSVKHSMYGKPLHYPTLTPFRTGIFLLLLGLVFLVSTPAQARDIVHVVQKGQNLGMIAKRYPPPRGRSSDTTA